MRVCVIEGSFVAVSSIGRASRPVMAPWRRLSRGNGGAGGGLGRAVLQAVLCRGSGSGEGIVVINAPTITFSGAEEAPRGSGRGWDGIAHAVRRAGELPSETRWNHSAVSTVRASSSSSSPTFASMSPPAVTHPNEHHRRDRHHRRNQRAGPSHWIHPWSSRGLASSSSSSSNDRQSEANEDDDASSSSSSSSSSSAGGGGPPSMESFTDRMVIAKDAGDFQTVGSIFEELCEAYPEDQGQAAYEILIRCAAMAGDPDAALDTMEAMMSLGYGPKVHTHGKIILAYNNAKNPRKALEWIEMLAESEGPEYMLNEGTRAGVRLYNKVLEGAARVADQEVFHECWSAMKKMGVTPDENTMAAFMDMESKLGVSPSIEAVWRHEEFDHISHPRSARLMCRRVESHCKVATYLLRVRDKRRGGRGNVGFPSTMQVTVGGAAAAGGDSGGGVGGVGGGGVASSDLLTENDRLRIAAADARRHASLALDDLYELVSSSMVPISHVGETTTLSANHKREIRDAATHLVNAYSVVGNSDAIRDVMERLSTVDVPADQYMFNGLLRSEAADRSLGMVNGVELDGDNSWWREVVVGGGGGGGDDGGDEGGDAAVGNSGRNVAAAEKRSTDEGEEDIFDFHNPELQKAVIRVEEMMRDMVESGVEPDLHSFMALLTAYARVGDVAAAGDALEGMRQRGIPLDTWVFNTLLQACSTACDLESAIRVRDQMRGTGLPADDITFLHLFTACAKRTRQVTMATRDLEDGDDWDDWIGGGGGGGTIGDLLSQQAARRAALTGALVNSSGATKAPSVGEAARAAAAAAREGLSSMKDIIIRGGFDADGSSLSSSATAGGGVTGSGTLSPELDRAREALIQFRGDMLESGVEFSLQCASALLQTLGSLGEYSAMMQFLRDPPPGVEPDVKMYNHALYALAQAPASWQQQQKSVVGNGGGGGGGGGGHEISQRSVPTGPSAALALADEMQTTLGLKFTRHTINCVLMACCSLADYSQAIRRFDAHVAAGGEVGIDTFNLLFKASLASGSFDQHARGIADMIDARGIVSPDGATQTILRRAGRGAYTADQGVAEELLRRWGFEDELTRQEEYKTMFEMEQSGGEVDDEEVEQEQEQWEDEHEDHEYRRDEEGGEDGEEDGGEWSYDKKKKKKQGRRWNRKA